LTSITHTDVIKDSRSITRPDELSRNDLSKLATVHERHRQTDTQRSDSIGRTVLQTVAQKLTENIRSRFIFLKHPVYCVFLQRFGYSSGVARYAPPRLKTVYFSVHFELYKVTSPTATVCGCLSKHCLFWDSSYAVQSRRLEPGCIDSFPDGTIPHFHFSSLFERGILMARLDLPVDTDALSDSDRVTE